jgi:flagellar basal body L-ring protein FlgH
MPSWRNHRTGSAKASLFSPRQEPLFADQRADDVGDIVTVLIKISDSATSAQFVRIAARR